jgi:hypothetical protein
MEVGHAGKLLGTWPIRLAACWRYCMAGFHAPVTGHFSARKLDLLLV